MARGRRRPGPRHGAKAEQGLAGVRWTRTAPDGTPTHGAWPGTFDPSVLAGVRLASRAPGAGDARRPLDLPILAELFPGWIFTAVDIAPTSAGPVAEPVIARLVVADPAPPLAAPGNGIGPGLRSKVVLLDGIDAVLAFFHAHAAKPADASAAADQTIAFASLCRYDSWEGPLTSERDGGFISALAVGLPGQRKQAGQLTLVWGAGGLCVGEPRPPSADAR